MNDTTLKDPTFYTIVDNQSHPLAINTSIPIQVTQSSTTNNTSPKLNDTAIVKTADQSPGVNYTITVS